MSFRRATFATQPSEGSRLLSVLKLGSDTHSETPSRRQTRLSVPTYSDHRVVHVWMPLTHGGVVLQMPGVVVGKATMSDTKPTEWLYNVEYRGKRKLTFVDVREYFIQMNEKPYDWKYTSWASGHKVHVINTDDWMEDYWEERDKREPDGTIVDRKDYYPFHRGGLWTVKMNSGKLRTVHGDNMKAVDKDRHKTYVKAIEGQIIARWGAGVLRYNNIIEEVD